MDTFANCDGKWCPQANTNHQYTRCGSTNGNTCENPEVRYGTVSGGIPGQHPDNDYQLWCEQIFESAVVIRSDVTYGSRDCSSPKGKLFWCTSYDEIRYKWCDWTDGYWKDQILNRFRFAVTIRCDMTVTSLTCEYTGKK